jgi:hypothetical protein
MAQESFLIRLHLSFRTGQGVKIAVIAFAPAKRDMKIQTDCSAFRRGNSFASGFHTKPIRLSSGAASPRSKPGIGTKRRRAIPNNRLLKLLDKQHNTITGQKNEAFSLGILLAPGRRNERFLPGALSSRWPPREKRRLFFQKYL